MRPDDTARGSAQVPDVDLATARELVARGAVYLDVREPDEWTEAHIAGARHVPLGDLDPAAVATGTRVITVCRSGNRSRRAAALLAGAGHDVVNLDGGMTAWQEAGLPVRSGPGPEVGGRGPA